MTRDLIVKEARRWIGTPYVHQQACLGAGCDCLGLLRGVWARFERPLGEPIPAYTMDWSEVAGEERLWAAARRYLVASEVERPGDVLLFRMADRAVAKHLGIQGRVGPEASFIHAYSGYGVTESPLSDPWRRRIVARFSFPSAIEETR